MPSSWLSQLQWWLCWAAMWAATRPWWAPASTHWVSGTSLTAMLSARFWLVAPGAATHLLHIGAPADALIPHPLLPCLAGAVELRNEIGGRVGCDLPGTLVFDYPTAAAIAAYLADRLAPPAPAGTQAEGAVAEHINAAAHSSLVPAAGQPEQQLVLITDIRSRLAALPGAASQSADPIRAVPHDRWDADFGRTLAGFGQGAAGRLTGSSSSSSTAGVLGGRFGGFVLEWAAFDPELFAIPPSGACGHLLLPVANSSGSAHAWSLP